MRRREFIAVLAGAAAWPLTAAGETKVPIIGVLVGGNPDPEPFLKALREGLEQFNYTEGKTLRLEIRSARGSATLLPQLAAELVRLNADIIVAYLTQPAHAAKLATNNIPIIMAGVGDPLGTGLVASLARPGGNITGSSSASAEAVIKSFEFIREMLPAASRVAVLARVDDPFTNIFLAQIEAGARIAGVSIRPVMIYPTQKFDAAFEDMKTNQTDAIIIQGAAYCTKMLPIWLSKIDFLRSPRTDSCLRWEA